MLESYLKKLDYMKSISEQAELNGLQEANFMPDHLQITLKSKKIRIWFKTGEIEQI